MTSLITIGAKIKWSRGRGGAFENQRAARTHQRQRAVDSGAISGAIDHHVETGLKLIFKLDFKSQSLQTLQFLRMMPADDWFIGFGLEDRRDDRAEASVSEHQNPGVAPERNLVEDFVGGGDRLDEHRGFVGNRVGERAQVALRQGQVVRESAVTRDDPEHAAVGAMSSETIDTCSASPASRVDLAHYPLSNQRLVRTGNDFSHEFMPWHATVSHVAANEFEVCPADSCQLHANQAFASGGSRVGIV